MLRNPFVGHRLSVRSKVLFGPLITLLLVAVLGTAVLINLRAGARTNDQLLRADEVLLRGQSLLRNLVDMQTGELGYVITGRNEFFWSRTRKGATARKATSPSYSNSP